MKKKVARNKTLEVYTYTDEEKSKVLHRLIEQLPRKYLGLPLIQIAERLNKLLGREEISIVFRSVVDKNKKEKAPPKAAKPDASKVKTALSSGKNERRDTFDITSSELKEVLDLLRAVDEALADVKEFLKKCKSKVSSKDGRKFVSKEADKIAEDHFKKIRERIRRTNEGYKVDTTDPVSRLIFFNEGPRSRRGAFWRSSLESLKKQVEYFLEREREYRAKTGK